MDIIQRAERVDSLYRHGRRPGLGLQSVMQAKMHLTFDLSIKIVILHALLAVSSKHSSSCNLSTREDISLPSTSKM